MLGLAAALVGAALTALVSTLGDWVWATWIPRHRPVFGLAHGTLLCLWIGLFLGLLAARPGRGALGGAAIGFLCAGGFYALAPFAGYSAMFVLWSVLWMLLGALYGRVLIRQDRLGSALLRGALAAVGSGLAFYAISDIWLAPPPGGPRYPVHLVSWTLAYLPGFLALLLRRQPPTPLA
jgi:hypothetical protein